MSIETIAGRYAQALYELGTEQNNLAQVREELRQVSATYQSSQELRTILDNPQVDAESRTALMNDILQRVGVSPTVRSVVGLLLQRRRVLLLPLVSRALDRLADEQTGVLRAQVTTAAELPESYFTKLREQLEQATGKKVLLERSIDPALLGGVVTRIGDRIIDGSLRARLGAMKTALLSN
jgi:F-type H+-transporting ATPase subunit delta